MTKCRACDLNGHNFLHRKLEVVRTVAAIQRHGPMNPDIFATTSLTEGGIRSLIRLNGSLPEAYRFTAWKFLLRLPGNSSCFLELLRRGPHPTALDSLSTRYPLRDRRLYRKTAVLLSALAYWSPIWAEAEFVPGWLFPFVVVFQQDDLGAFEAAMSFLLHWGSRLLVTFPQPPVPILAGMELALRRVDPELSAHLETISVGALTYGWPLLRDAFSHALSRGDWLRLLDRLLSSPKRPEMLEAAAVGFVVASRASLLRCRSITEVKAIFLRLPAAPGSGGGRSGRSSREGGTIDVDHMFRVMDRVARLRSPEAWGSNHNNTNKRGGGSLEGRDHADAMTVNALAFLRSAPRKFQPLPRGEYPVFDGYPQFVINYQSELRERVASQERDADRKRQLRKDLDERANSISTWEIDSGSADGAPVFSKKATS